MAKQSEKRTGPGLVLTKSGIKFAYNSEEIVKRRRPYIKGRDVDVSYAMAKQLGFVKKGITKLDIETI